MSYTTSHSPTSHSLIEKHVGKGHELIIENLMGHFDNLPNQVSQCNLITMQATIRVGCAFGVIASALHPHLSM